MTCHKPIGFAMFRGRLPHPGAADGLRALGFRFQHTVHDWTVCSASPEPLPAPVLVVYRAAIGNGDSARSPAQLSEAGDACAVELLPKRLLARRAVSGGPPLYYVHTDEFVALSTRLEACVRLSRKRDLDPLTTALWFSGISTFPDDRSFITDICTLAPGKQLELGEHRAFNIARYWTPPDSDTSPPTPTQVATHAAELMEGLTTCVQVELPEQHTLAFMSGGVDSSLLASLALAQGKALGGLSLLPPSHNPACAREASFTSFPSLTRELRYHWQIRMEESLWLENQKSNPASVFPVCYPAMPYFRQIWQRYRPEALLMGVLADEHFGGRMRLVDWADQTQLVDVLWRRVGWPLGLRTPLSWLRRRLGPHAVHFPPPKLPPLFATSVQEAYADWRERFLESTAYGNGLARTDFRDGTLAELWEGLAPYGVRPCLPFMSLPLTELAYRLHPAAVIRDQTKHLLRLAAQGHQPELHRTRTDKGGWYAYGDRPVHPMPPLNSELVRLLEPSWLESHHGRRLPFDDALRLIAIGHMLRSIEEALR